MGKVTLVYVPFSAPVFRTEIALRVGLTVRDALEQSGVYHSHPETRDLPVGIFSRQVTLETLLTAGDRLELYRPLTMDPKEKRRLRARVRSASKRPV